MPSLISKAKPEPELPEEERGRRGAVEIVGQERDNLCSDQAYYFRSSSPPLLFFFMHMERVVVTGLGAVTPIGLTASAFWNGVVEGKNGVKPITLVDRAPHKVRFAGEISEFDPLNYIDRKEARKMDRFVQFACVASDEALADSGLKIDEENR